MQKWGCKLGILALLLFGPTGHADQYANWKALSSVEKENIDYRVEVIDRDSPISVLAIHGGRIEPGTCELALAVARNQMNTYLFQGLKAGDNFSLHITSAHFDEPKALNLAARSQLCISIHGFSGTTPAVCLGGGNAALAERVAQAFRKNHLPFAVNYPCTEFPGSSPRNIVNRCEKQGLQLEFSAAARAMFSCDGDLLAKTAAIIRDEAKAYLQ
jgi:phage replication-related protein YjqB (UPF0714/DUF867 family)